MTTDIKESHDTHDDTEAIESAEPMLTGLLAEFADVDGVMEGAIKTRAAGYKVWDVHSPFPIHGIDAVIGIRPTILPWLVLCGGLVGGVTGFGLQWFCNTFDYPYMVSAKPLLSLPADVPVIFECTVLFSALTAVFGMLALNRLPLLYNPMFKSARFKRVTNDRFFIWIDATDAKFDEKATAEFLTSVGATAVERIED
ncbi:MAG TPA: DUF3341 domain-containing protein [Tepidisphaeraceae bacterium]|jgi:hypothetical protein